MDAPLRAARLGDGRALASLWIAWAREYERLDVELFRVPSSEGLATWFEGRLAAADDDQAWFVADGDEGVVAFLQAEVWRPNEDSERSLLVDDVVTTLKVGLLVVKPTVRRHGIASALSDAAESWGRGRGATRVVVIAVTASPTAIPFYRRQGFQPFTTGFWKPLG
ncbi:MAG: GNAT family N-acetyltransferase [Actinomycetota bacterium]